MSIPVKVLVVDDDPILCELIPELATLGKPTRVQRKRSAPCNRISPYLQAASGACFS